MLLVRDGVVVAAARLDGSVSNIAAALHAVEADVLYDPVGAPLSRFDRVPEGGHAQHASSRRDDLAVLQRGARVKYPEVLPCGGKAGDDIAFFRRIRITRCRQHHAERDTAVPFRVDAIQAALHGMLDQLEQVALETQQDRLGFRIAEAAVVFQHLGMARSIDHQSGVEKAGVGLPFHRHAGEHRLDDFAHNPGVTTGAGEYAPMPPVLGPSSPSFRRLWSWLVARGSTCLPSARTMKLASSPSRNSSMTTRFPAAPIARSTSRRSIARCASAALTATTTPLPAARPLALTTMGAPREST